MDGDAKTAAYDEVANRVSLPIDGDCEKDQAYMTLPRRAWEQRFWKELRTKLITDS